MNSEGGEERAEGENLKWELLVDLVYMALVYGFLV